MRRLFVAALACVAVLLPVAPMASATLRADKATAMRPGSVGMRSSPDATFAPLARRFAGTATITADVYQPTGVASGYGTAQLVVWADDGTVAFSQTATTDYKGHVTFSGVPAASTSGELAYWPSKGGGAFVYDTWDLSWTDPEGAAFVLLPGTVPVSIVAGGIWKQYFSYAAVDAFSSEAGVSKFVETGIARATTEPTSGTAAALGGTLDALNVYFFSDEGVEVPTSDVTVTPGSSTSGFTALEAAAQRMINTTWASGKPGSVFRVKFNNFPAGWMNRLTGDDTATPKAADKSFGSWTSVSRSSQTRTLTVPRTATPGFTYRIVAQHTNGARGDRDLTLSEPFQVCTLNPNRPFTRPPYDLYFTGRVPNDGHRKRVMLYRRYTGGGQPSYAGGFLEKKGWRRIESWHAGSDGRFRSHGNLEDRTAWYCLWYAGDSTHWAAWTSVVKVPHF
jgi:hypothetical protein